MVMPTVSYEIAGLYVNVRGVSPEKGVILDIYWVSVRRSGQVYICWVGMQDISRIYLFRGVLVSKKPVCGHTNSVITDFKRFSWNYQWGFGGVWQGRKDSNPRMPDSESGALTNLATPLHQGRYHSIRKKSACQDDRHFFRKIF